MEKNLLVTFHPVTLETYFPERDITELLKALHNLEDHNIIFTMPNADTNGRTISKLITNFVNDNPNKSKAFTSMGQINYLSCMKYVNAIIGNSSSGIIEGPSMKIATINIGDRQKGRVKANSIIDCDANCESILKNINRIYDPNYQKSLKKERSIHMARAVLVKKIVKLLESIQIENILKKSFIICLFFSSQNEI